MVVVVVVLLTKIVGEIVAVGLAGTRAVVVLTMVASGVGRSIRSAVGSAVGSGVVGTVASGVSGGVLIGVVLVIPVVVLIGGVALGSTVPVIGAVPGSSRASVPVFGMSSMISVSAF